MPPSIPRWTNPENQRVRPPGFRAATTPKFPKEPQRKCGCGCKAFAGWHSGRGHSHKARRFLPGHQVSKMSLENTKLENEMAEAQAEAEARREIEEFDANLNLLLAEARELGLTGDAKVAYVFNNDMEDAALRKVVRKAVLEGHKESANWLYGRKHGGVNKGGASKAVKEMTAPSFLDASATAEDPSDWDD